MRQRTWMDWLRATRPWSFSVSTLPALAAFGWLAGRLPTFHVAHAALTLGVLVFAHAGANVLSDCRDAETGVDGADAANGVTWIRERVFGLGELRAFGWSLLSVGALCGLVVVLGTTPSVIIPGLAGLVLAGGYSILKRHALGDVAVLLAFTVIPAAGLGLVFCGRLEPLCLPVLLPNGLLILAILHVNNVRDRVTDSVAGCRTLAACMSLRSATVLLALELFVPYLLVMLLMATRVVPYAALAVFLTLPMACCEYAAFRRGDLAARDQGVARVQALFGGLYALSFAVATLGFWVQLTLGAVILGGLSWRGRPRFPDSPLAVLREVLLGVLMAAALWGVFWLGDLCARALFGFARAQVEAVYALRADVSPIVLGGLLLLVIGPAEEFFWRGTLQRRLAERLGANAGFLIATAAYALVHVFSGNFMLVGAAGVCGLFWGLAYRLFPSHFTAILVSHALWDVTVFLVFPI